MFFFVIFIKWTQMNEEEKLKKKLKLKKELQYITYYAL
jgi:hypothetical protein